MLGEGLRLTLLEWSKGVEYTGYREGPRAPGEAAAIVPALFLLSKGKQSEPFLWAPWT